MVDEKELRKRVEGKGSLNPQSLLDRIECFRKFAVDREGERCLVLHLFGLEGLENRIVEPVLAAHDRYVRPFIQAGIADVTSAGKCLLEQYSAFSGAQHARDHFRGGFSGANSSTGFCTSSVSNVVEIGIGVLENTRQIDVAINLFVHDEIKFEYTGF